MHGSIRAHWAIYETTCRVGGATFHPDGVVVYPRSFPSFTPMIKTLFALDWHNPLPASPYPSRPNRLTPSYALRFRSFPPSDCYQKPLRTFCKLHSLPLALYSALGGSEAPKKQTTLNAGHSTDRSSHLSSRVKPTVWSSRKRKALPLPKR